MLLENLKIDDPVVAIPVHFFAGIWGLVAVGIFDEKEISEDFNCFDGVFKGGSFSFLGYQIVAGFLAIVWAGITTLVQVFFYFFYYSIPIFFHSHKTCETATYLYQCSEVATGGG